MATWKVLFSLGATPTLYILYAMIATYVAYRHGASSGTLYLIPLSVFIIMPFFAMSSLRFGEAGMDVFK